MKKSKDQNKVSQDQIIAQAINFHLKGNISEAIKYYQYLINEECNDYSVFSNYGAILYGLGKLKEAELLTLKAIAINPNFSDPYCNLGLILRDQGKLKEAELFNRKAIQIDPDIAIANCNLGHILRDQGELKEAELFTRKAIEIDHNHLTANYNLAVILRDQGKLKEAELSILKSIEIDPNSAKLYALLGSTMKDQVKLKEAELFTRKAIEIEPNFAQAHSNLGSILRDIGNLRDSEISLRNAIELNPNLTITYYCLSLLKKTDQSNKWMNQLFSDNILINKLPREKTEIYFARANILHNEKKYEESSKNFLLANNLKLSIESSQSESIIDQSTKLLNQYDQLAENKKNIINFPESIFIVGMPRSGSTLLESILSMNTSVNDLGETNIFEESFKNWIEYNQKNTLSEEYWRRINNNFNQLKITTNKWLFNYMYAGVIAKNMPKAKIIHCFRNPLDNILSIFKAHFAKGNSFSSSLIDSAKVYLNQEEVMEEYKKKFKSAIYELNYDSLVNNPKKEIKSLISWFGWEWDNKYLSPHLNPRSISTASTIEVRSPINKKSIGGWKNYKEMLEPAMKIITQKDKYKHLKY